MSRLLLALPIIALFMGLVTVAHEQSTMPTVSTVGITSSPGSDNTYAGCDTIAVSLTFNEAVAVTGTPYVTIDIGGQPRNAAYTGAGTATGQILFGYTVRTGDRDSDGVSVLANSLTLNGGAIQSTDDSTDAALTHSVMTFATHKVDTDSTLANFLNVSEGSAITISATQSHTMTITPRFAESGYELSGIVLDVKTPSPTLEVTGTLTIRDNNPNFQQPLVFTGLEGFMGLGLVVGIAALGVIAARSVVERRHQIGVLRALGFQKGMVQLSFLLESSFIALLGIAIGIVLGMGLSYNLINEVGKEIEGLAWRVPWLNIAVVIVIAYGASLLTTFLPARQAAKVYPAEALRFE